MLDCRFKPIDAWQGKATPAYNRKKSPFKAKWSQTLDLLERELNYLHAKDIIIDGYFRYTDLRNDGWPKSLAQPSQPGVVLSFDTKRGRMNMPCDSYTDWEANLRAIALTLECLRTVERYGVTSDLQEQYTGWLKLPAVSAQDEALEHAKTLCRFADRADSLPTLSAALLTDPALFEQVWKEAVKKTHPDTGGNGLHFQQVMTSRDRIRAIRGWQ